MVLVEPEHRAVYAAIADQQVRAQPQHVSRDVVLVAAPRRLLQLLHAPRPNQPTRRATNAVPGVRREGRVLAHALLEAGKQVVGAELHAG